MFHPPSIIVLLTARTKQSQASRLAPSQRGATDYHLFVSTWPLAELVKQITGALDKLPQRTPYQIAPLQKVDIQPRDSKQGGDGCVIEFATRDKRQQNLGGHAKIMREFDSPLIEELAPFWTRSEQVEVYVVKFSKTKGDQMEFRRLYQAVKVAMPVGCVSGS